jgi:hypothetical protein
MVETLNLCHILAYYLFLLLLIRDLILSHIIGDTILTLSDIQARDSIISIIFNAQPPDIKLT